MGGGWDSLEVLRDFMLAGQGTSPVGDCSSGGRAACPITEGLKSHCIPGCGCVLG